MDQNKGSRRSHSKKLPNLTDIVVPELVPSPSANELPPQQDKLDDQLSLSEALRQLEPPPAAPTPLSADSVNGSSKGVSRPAYKKKRYFSTFIIIIAIIFSLWFANDEDAQNLVKDTIQQTLQNSGLNDFLYKTEMSDKLRALRLKTKHPVVFIPGIVTSSLEVYAGVYDKNTQFPTSPHPNIDLFDQDNFNAFLSTFDDVLFHPTEPDINTTPKSSQSSSQSKKKSDVSSKCLLPTHKSTLWGGPSMVSNMLLQSDCFIKQLRLNSTTGLDNSFIQLRAVEGNNSADYLITGYWVWKRIVEFLDKTSNPNMLHMSTYDWRLSFKALEIRDGYFTKLKQQIERMVMMYNEKAVIINHSMGGLVTQYFLQYVRWTERVAFEDNELLKFKQSEIMCQQFKDHSSTTQPTDESCQLYVVQQYNENDPSNWFDRHIQSVVGIGSPYLGVSKAISSLISGEMKDIAALGEIGNYFRRTTTFNDRAVIQLLRSFHSVASMLPKGGEVIWGGEYTFKNKLSNTHPKRLQNDIGSPSPAFHQDNELTYYEPTSLSAPDDLWGFTTNEFDYTNEIEQLFDIYANQHHDATTDKNQDSNVNANSTQSSVTDSNDIMSLGNRIKKYFFDFNLGGDTNDSTDFNTVLQDINDDFVDGTDDNQNVGQNHCANATTDTDNALSTHNSDSNSTTTLKSKCVAKNTISNPSKKNLVKENDLNKLQQFVTDMVGRFNTWFTNTTAPAMTETANIDNDNGNDNDEIENDNFMYYDDDIQEEYTNDEEDTDLITLVRSRNKHRSQSISQPKQPQSDSFLKDPFLQSFNSFFNGKSSSSSRHTDYNANDVDETHDNYSIDSFADVKRKLETTFQQLAQNLSLWTSPVQNTIQNNGKQRRNRKNNTESDNAVNSNTGTLSDTFFSRFGSSNQPSTVNRYAQAKTTFVKGFSTLLTGLIQTLTEVEEYHSVMLKRFNDAHDDGDSTANALVQNASAIHGAIINSVFNGNTNDPDINTAIAPEVTKKAKKNVPNSRASFIHYLHDFLHAIQASAPITIPSTFSSHGEMVLVVKKNLFDLDFSPLNQVKLEKFDAVIDEIDGNGNSTSNNDDNTTPVSNSTTENKLPQFNQPSCWYDNLLQIEICNQYKIDFITTFQTSLMSTLLNDLKNSAEHIEITDFFQLIAAWTHIIQLPSDSNISPQEYALQQKQNRTQAFQDSQKNTTSRSIYQHEPPRWDLNLVRVLAKEWFYSIYKYVYIHRPTAYSFSTPFSIQSENLFELQQEQEQEQQSPQEKSKSGNMDEKDGNDTIDDKLHPFPGKNSTSPSDVDITVSSQKKNMKMHERYPSQDTKKHKHPQFSPNSNKSKASLDQNCTKSDNDLKSCKPINIFNDNTLFEPLRVRSIDLPTVLPDVKPVIELIVHQFDVIMSHLTKIRSYTADTRCILADQHKYTTSLFHELISAQKAHKNDQNILNGTKNGGDEQIRSCFWDLLHREAPMYSEKMAYEYSFDLSPAEKYAYKPIYTEMYFIHEQFHKMSFLSTFYEQSTLYDILSSIYGPYQEDISQKLPQWAQLVKYLGSLGDHLVEHKQQSIAPTGQGAILTFQYLHRKSYMANYWIDLPLLLPNPTHLNQANNKIANDKSHSTADSTNSVKINENEWQIDPHHQINMFTLYAHIIAKNPTIPVIAHNKTSSTPLPSQIPSAISSVPFTNSQLVDFHFASLFNNPSITFNFINAVEDFQHFYFASLRAKDYFTNLYYVDQHTTKKQTTQDIMNYKHFLQQPATPISRIFSDSATLDSIITTYCTLLHSFNSTSSCPYILSNGYRVDVSRISQSIASHPVVVNTKSDNAQGDQNHTQKNLTTSLTLVPIRYTSAWGLLYRHIGGISRQYTRSSIIDTPFVHQHLKTLGNSTLYNHFEHFSKSLHFSTISSFLENHSNTTATPTAPSTVLDRLDAVVQNVLENHVSTQLHGNMLFYELLLDYYFNHFSTTLSQPHHLHIHNTVADTLGISSNITTINQQNQQNNSTSAAVRSYLQPKIHLLSHMTQQLYAVSTFTLDVANTYRVKQAPIAPYYTSTKMGYIMNIDSIQQRTDNFKLIHSTKSLEKVSNTFPIITESSNQDTNSYNEQLHLQYITRLHHYLPAPLVNSHNSIPSLRYIDVDDRDWSNILATGLPSGTTFDLYNLYGVNRNTERNYIYSGASAGISTDPTIVDQSINTMYQLTPTTKIYLDVVEKAQSFAPNSPKDTLSSLTNDDKSTKSNTRLKNINHKHVTENGVTMTNGDGTVPLLSVGWVGAPGGYLEMLELFKKRENIQHFFDHCEQVKKMLKNTQPKTPSSLIPVDNDIATVDDKLQAISHSIQELLTLDLPPRQLPDLLDVHLQELPSTIGTEIDELLWGAADPNLNKRYASCDTLIQLLMEANDDHMAITDGDLFDPIHDKVISTYVDASADLILDKTQFNTDQDNKIVSKSTATNTYPSPLHNNKARSTPSSTKPHRRRFINREYKAGIKYIPYFNIDSSFPSLQLLNSTINFNSTSTNSTNTFTTPTSNFTYNTLNTSTLFDAIEHHYHNVPPVPVSSPITIPTNIDSILVARLWSEDHVDIMGNDNLIMDIAHILGYYDVNEKLYDYYHTQLQNAVQLSSHSFRVTNMIDNFKEKRTQLMLQSAHNNNATTTSTTSTQTTNPSVSRADIDKFELEIKVIDDKIKSLEHALQMLTVELETRRKDWVETPFSVYPLCSQIESNGSTTLFSSSINNDCVTKDGKLVLGDRIISPIVNMAKIATKRVFQAIRHQL